VAGLLNISSSLASAFGVTQVTLIVSVYLVTVYNVLRKSGLGLLVGLEQDNKV